MAQNDPDVGGPLILLVEDFVPLLRNMAFLLTVVGYEVITATDGIKALEIVQDRKPDLIISDIDMPNMSGHDLLRCLRADGRYRTIPFIFTSDKYALSDFLYGLDLGADDYVPKPFDIYDLLDAIGRTQALVPHDRLRPSA